MGAIFKGIGKGLLNIVLIPAFLVGLAFSAIAGIGIFLLELFKQLGRFFTGKPLSCELLTVFCAGGNRGRFLGVRDGS